MRLLAWAALAACVSSAPAMAATVAPPLSGAAPGSAPAEAPAGSMRIAMRQETLPPGGKLAEHRQEGERYLFVVSGRLKVANLVTGEEQVVGAGKMAAEQPGDWYGAEVVGEEAATFYVIDRTPAEGPAATASRAGN